MADYVNKPELRELWDLMKQYVEQTTYTREEIEAFDLLPEGAIDGKTDKIDTYSREQIDSLMLGLRTVSIIEGGSGGAEVEAMTRVEVLELLE